MSYTLVENDTGVTLKVTCTEGDPPQAVDLTDCTVTLRWRANGDVSEKVMTMLDPTRGVVTYTFLEGEIESPVMEFEITITDPQGKDRTSLDTFKEFVRERLA